MDITDVPMARGFVYLVAVVDWFSRKVLAWRLSMTLETGPCLEALSEALAWYGPPEILNTDQGSQFTSVAFLTALQDAKIAISMDGKGAWRDNVFVERLWRTIQYEEVYLRASRSVSEARRGLDRSVAFYNRRRPHSSLGGQNARSGLCQPANANPGGGLTSAEIHLSIAHKLFKIDEPPLHTGQASTITKDRWLPEATNAVLIEECLNRDENEVAPKCLGYQHPVEGVAKGTLQRAGAGCVFHGYCQPLKVLIGYVAGNVLG